MQDQNQCLRCQANFNLYLHKPIILPCYHIACLKCLYQEFQEQLQNKCPSCQTITKQDPNELPLNQDIVKEIERKQQQDSLDNMSRVLEELKHQKNEIVAILKMNYQQKVNFVVKITELLNQTLFKSINNLQDNLKSKHSIICKIINQIEIFIKEKNIKNFQRQKIDLNETNVKFMEEVKKKINDEIQKIEKIKENLINWFN